MGDKYDYRRIHNINYCKKPYYKQSAVVFCVLSAVFLVVGLSLVLHKDKILLFEIPLVVGVIIYAIASTVQINKRQRKK